ncbi:MAG TPA: hypothetical protein VHN79_06990 [Lacunisphaera sp.]|nr:hypothetical protein [Lacunisphaera sp.]
MEPVARSGGSRFLTFLARLQGGFYLATGVWPLVAPASFQVVIGGKEDFWLAQTVGALIGITGIVLLLAARRATIAAEIALLAALQAVALGIIDLYCVPLPNTTAVYYLDAVAEFCLAAGWAVGWWRQRRSGQFVS